MQPLFVNRPQPDDLEEIVSRLRAEWPFDGSIAVISARQKSRNRALVEIQHEIGDTRVRMVVKRAQRDRVERGHKALEVLWAAGFAPPSALRVPRPVLLIPDAGVSVQERAPGMPLTAVFDDGGFTGQVVPAIRGYISRLQSSPVPAEPVSPASFILDTEQIELPEAAELSRRIASGIQRELSDRSTFVPAHGDLSPKHIFFDPEAISFIDWDKFSLAPPSLDFGFLFARSAIAGWTEGDAFERTRDFRSRLLTPEYNTRGVASFAAYALLAAASAVVRWTAGAERARMMAYVAAADRVARAENVDCL